MSAYINFEKQTRHKGWKTDWWKVWTGGKDFDEEGEQYVELGIIKWWCGWRRYVFFPEEGTFYEPGCLREMADFCEHETKAYKAGNKQHKEGE